MKTPWMLVCASNSGYSMIAYLLRQLTKSNILWFVPDLWPLKILAPTWTQIYFFRNASSGTEINLMKWKHHGCLLAQRAVSTLKVHIVLHEPLSGLLLCIGIKKMFRKLLKILNQQDPNFFLFVLLELWFVYHFPRFLQFFDVGAQS